MTETRSANKTQVTLAGDRELVVTRTFEAPPAMVFKAWTEPELIKLWWGPRAWPVRQCSVDLREGGRWHYCMQGPDGEESWGIGIYKRIEPPKHLVIEDYFSDAEGTLKPPPSTMAIEFQEQPGQRTTVVGRSTFSSPEHRDEVVAMGMTEGISEALDQLSELLERQTGRPA